MFEYLKINLIKDMKEKYGIDVVPEKIVSVKTNDKELKKATVEFQASANFIKGGKNHGIKITLYSTHVIFLPY